MRHYTSIVNKSLDRCEEQWSNTLGRERLIKKAKEEETRIPGHPYLGEHKYKSDQFIALMLDMRDSTMHLRQSISGRVTRVDLIQRVFYEISALLPAMAKVIQDKEGAVTEYLGDGLLALFQLPREKDSKESVIRNSMTASKNCLEALKKIVNPILSRRYGLPPLEIGIGLAFSDAIISHFGLSPNTQVKVIGNCIYFASRLSKERNKIVVHEWLENIWPTSKTGKIRFSRKYYENFSGYGFVVIQQ